MQEGSDAFCSAVDEQQGSSMPARGRGAAVPPKQSQPTGGHDDALLTSELVFAEEDLPGTTFTAGDLACEDQTVTSQKGSIAVWRQLLHFLSSIIFLLGLPCAAWGVLGVTMLSVPGGLAFASIGSCASVAGVFLIKWNLTSTPAGSLQVTLDPLRWPALLVCVAVPLWLLTFCLSPQQAYGLSPLITPLSLMLGLAALAKPRGFVAREYAALAVAIVGVCTISQYRLAARLSAYRDLTRRTERFSSIIGECESLVDSDEALAALRVATTTPKWLASSGPLAGSVVVLDCSKKDGIPMPGISLCERHLPRKLIANSPSAARLVVVVVAIDRDPRVFGGTIVYGLTTPLYAWTLAYSWPGRELALSVKLDIRQSVTFGKRAGDPSVTLRRLANALHEVLTESHPR